MANQVGVMNYQAPSQANYGYTNPVMTQPQPPPQPQAQMQQMNNQVNITLNSSPQTVVDPFRDWNTGLCGCCEDVSSCLCVLLCAPCYVCCSLSERVGENCCTPICLSMVYPGMFLPVLVYRTKLRAKYNIRGSAIDDCCCTMCCGPLVTCQIKRELDHIERDTGLKAF